MKRLIRKILREELNKSDKYYRFLDKISSIIELPYFRNMYEKYNGGFWDITDRDDQEYIMKNIYGDDILLLSNNTNILFSHQKDLVSFLNTLPFKTIFDGYDDSSGWKQFIIHSPISYEELLISSLETWVSDKPFQIGKSVDDFSGDWFNENGLDEEDGWWTYTISSGYDDYIVEEVLDSKGNRLYSETEEGFWDKMEYDDNGNVTYREDSNGKWVV